MPDLTARLESVERERAALARAVNSWRARAGDFQADAALCRKQMNEALSRIAELEAREVTGEMVEDAQHDAGVGGTWFRVISGTHAPNWQKGTRVAMRALHSPATEETP